jgi:hypothetical protein
VARTALELDVKRKNPRHGCQFGRLMA